MILFKEFYSKSENSITFLPKENITIRDVGTYIAKVDTGNDAYNALHGEDVKIDGNTVTFKTDKGKKIKMATANGATKKTYLTFEDGSKDSLSIAEAEKLGFEKIIISKHNQKSPDAKRFSIEIVTVGRIEEVYKILF